MSGRVGIIMLGFGIALTACAQPGGVVDPGQQPEASRIPAPAGAEFKTAEELLNALESADKDLVSLTADVKYDRIQEIQGDRQIRLGKLFFVVDPPAPGDQAKTPSRRFAIKFNRIYIGESVHDEDKTYIFDGQWLMEKDALAKFFVKRQVVAPGERFDPLRIGEGPFVLPIGQRKADIDKRYITQLLPSGDGLDAGPGADPSAQRDAQQVREAAAGSWQLQLTAKPEFAEKEDFSEIRLWYKRGTNGELLPRMARTIDKKGDVSLVLLTNAELQLTGKPINRAAAVPAEVLDTKVPAGWDGKVEPFRMHADGEEAGAKGQEPGGAGK